ncbi:MAG: M28 family peptidase, partial [Candidatus Eisenbacteria bacterium]|nr:M28 family peptidase [Candidatus Latescibacterota bacterium]MBD3303047.1 M28 family peptidase [Candidatus Eisenbacteria bacterium]
MIAPTKLLILGICFTTLLGSAGRAGPVPDAYRVDPDRHRHRIDGPGEPPAMKAPPRPFAPSESGARSDPDALQSLADAVRSDVMLLHLDSLSTGLMTRYYDTAGMAAASQYVYDRFADYGLDEVWFDDFIVNDVPVRNVVGVKAGAVDPDRIIMICGHLDSTSPENQTLAPGAEDNGSGSAGVLEAARLLAPLSTDASVYFVCFTAEEIGLVGSEHLAAIADAEGWDLQAVLNMDMVGYDRPDPPDLWIEGFPGNPGSVALMDLLEQTATAHTDLAVYRYPGDGWGSDHVPFNSYGFPAILAIDYDWNRYSCYHQTCDVVENLTPAHFREMIAAVTATGAGAAGLDATPGSVDGIADRTDDPDDAGILIEAAGTGYEPATSGQGGA